MPTNSNNPVLLSEAFRDDLRRLKERKADSDARNAMPKWKKLFEETTAALEQLRTPKKRAQMSKNIRNLRSILPLLPAADRDAIDCLLERVETFVKEFRPKQRRGDWMIPQLILQLAEISKVHLSTEADPTNRKPDWKWIGKTIYEEFPELNHGGLLSRENLWAKKQARWAMKKASKFKETPFGAFRTDPLPSSRMDDNSDERSRSARISDSVSANEDEEILRKLASARDWATTHNAAAILKAAHEKAAQKAPTEPRERKKSAKTPVKRIPRQK